MEAENRQNIENLQKNAMLPLDEPRVIAIRDGKFTYTFHFGRIMQPDWETYFDAIKVQARNDGQKRITTVDVDMAAVQLFESKLVKAEGYRGEFTSKEGWQQKIPPRHSRLVAEMLCAVGPSREESDEAYAPDDIEVRIDALWSRRSGAETMMYKGLVHRFAAPSVEQKRRFYNAGSQSVVVGGSRNGTTIYGRRHKTLLELYDQLILNVDGYSVGGKPLTNVNNAAEIRREIDAYHKFIAVQEIFASITPAEETEAAAA